MIIISNNVLFVSVKMQTLADDTEAGAFGPKARDTKIKNLTAYLFTRHLSSVEAHSFPSTLSFLYVLLQWLFLT